MDEGQLDLVLVPIGAVVFGIYHVWLVVRIKQDPTHTVVGLNAQSRRQWVLSLMTEPVKNGVLIVQTIRNSIMASTLLATTAITLSSIITVFVSSTTSSHNTSSKLIYGNKGGVMSSVKYFTLILCFLVAFLCNVQSIRYYAHVSFLSTLPTSRNSNQAMEYAARSLNRASFFWSVGLRAFYLSFPLFLWIFGPIPMLVCSCGMTTVLYFLDIPTSFTRQLHTHSFKVNDDVKDLETFTPV